jgi:hypothetical protein
MGVEQKSRFGAVRTVVDPERTSRAARVTIRWRRRLKVRVVVRYAIGSRV